MKTFKESFITILILLIGLITVNAQDVIYPTINENFVEIGDNLVMIAKTSPIRNLEKEIIGLVKNIPTEEYWNVTVESHYFVEVFTTGDPLWPWETMVNNDPETLTAYNDWQVMTNNVGEMISNYLNLK